MSLGKHTPGPWHTDEPYFIYVWGPEQQMVADLPPAGDEERYLARMRGVGRGTTEEEQRANAKLIAAAPEMGEMLLSIYQHVSHGGPSIADAEALLRKAGLL